MPRILTGGLTPLRESLPALATCERRGRDGHEQSNRRNAAAAEFAAAMPRLPFVSPTRFHLARELAHQVRSESHRFWGTQDRKTRSPSCMPPRPRRSQVASAGSEFPQRSEAAGQDPRHQHGTSTTHEARRSTTPTGEPDQ